MAFSPDSPPKRAGDYTRYAIQRATTLPPSTGGIVAIPFTDDWGPLDEAVLLTSFQEYLDVFGHPVDPLNPSEGFIAVYNAFKGESLTSPGAGAVLAYRHAGAAVGTATRNLAAGATNPALTIAAKYAGTRGNQYRVEVVANAANPGTQRDVRLYYGTVRKYTFEGISSAGITDLRDSINRVAGDEFVASAATNGTILDAVAATALTGGNDGTSLVAGDWTSTREGLEPHAFGYVAPANLTDSSVVTSFITWAATLNAAEKAKRFSLVIGGATAENFNTAATRSAGANNENVINLGVGTYRDTNLGLQLSTAQLATRLAGVAAARGGRSSLSMAYLEDLEIIAGPSEADILAAIDQGVVVLGRGTGGVKVEKGVTTYVTKTDNQKPFDTYSKVKYVKTMQDFERDGKEANENGDVIGKLAVNDDTREEILSREQGRLDQYVLRKEVQPGARVVLTPGYSDDDEHISIDWVGKFSRSLEQVRRTIIFS